VLRPSRYRRYTSTTTNRLGFHSRPLASRQDAAARCPAVLKRAGDHRSRSRAFTPIRSALRCCGQAAVRTRNRHLDPKWAGEEPGAGPGGRARNRGQDPVRGKEKCIADSQCLERSDGRRHPAHVRGAPSRKPRALYTRHEVLAYKPTTAQYPVRGVGPSRSSDASVSVGPCVEQAGHQLQQTGRKGTPH
jgi:hypothetical protein